MKRLGKVFRSQDWIEVLAAPDTLQHTCNNIVNKSNKLEKSVKFEIEIESDQDEK